MSTAGYGNPFTVCFVMMKIKYHEYDKSIDGLNFINRDDKVNVFINFESVLDNLSMIRDIENKLLLERKFPTILESEAINLCAHYKKFFRGNGLKTRVFLYYTDLSSQSFENFKYNDEYRSYYVNKFINNPKYQLLGNKLVDTIIPRIQKIVEFIPDVHFINGSGIDGSLVPMIIGESDKSYKNFIVTTDRCETQYLLDNSRYCVHYINRSPMGTKIYYKFNDYLTHLFKQNIEEEPDIELFENSSFYSTLLATIGDKTRSIDPLKGIGCKTMLKYLSTGIKDGLLIPNTNSFELIKKSIPEEKQEQAEENFNCISLLNQYKDLSEQHLFSVNNQIINRFDFNSLLKLNQTDYVDFPLMLQELTQ